MGRSRQVLKEGTSRTSFGSFEISIKNAYNHQYEVLLNQNLKNNEKRLRQVRNGLQIARIWGKQLSSAVSILPSWGISHIAEELALKQIKFYHSNIRNNKFYELSSRSSGLRVASYTTAAATLNSSQNQDGGGGGRASKYRGGIAQCHIIANDSALRAHVVQASRQASKRPRS